MVLCEKKMTMIVVTTTAFPSSVSSFAFLLPSSSALAYTPEPYRRSFRALLGVSGNSLDQSLVGQPLAGSAINEAVQPVDSMPLYIALIEPESELINVPAKVLRADMVEGAVN